MSSSRTLEIEIRRRVESDVRVAFTPEGVRTIREFLSAVMVVPAAGFAPDVRGLIVKLHGQLEDMAQSVNRGEQRAKEGIPGTSDAEVERNWFVEERAWFGLAKLNFVHRFLACVILPPRGGFSLYLAGIHHCQNTLTNGDSTARNTDRGWEKEGYPFYMPKWA